MLFHFELDSCGMVKGVLIAASAKTLSYFKLVQGLIVSQTMQRFTVYFQDLVTYRRSDGINSSGSHVC